MERKFKVGDRARTGSGNDVIVICDLYFNGHGDNYIVKYDDLTIGPQPESNLTLIPPKKLPEPKYKNGDKVWDKDTKSIWEFVCYQENNEVSIKKSNTFIFLTTLESDIEPYTGQDKVKEQLGSRAKNWLNLTKINHIFEDYEKAMDKILTTPKPHPYTVILKSGVKVGVTAEAKQELTGCISSTRGEPSGVFNTIVFQSKEYSFCVSEIAAIVPTENIVK